MYNKLDFAHETELSYNELEKRLRAYRPTEDLTIFKKAFEFSQKSHEGQKRSSGEDYFIHPCNVTAILIKLRVDMDSLIAGLLHDVIEDCHISPKDLRKEFSSEVVEIVIGMTKISQIKFKTREESQAENFRKMIIAMAKDLRVIIVKLADRMHNMRTLQYINDEKQKDIARETLDIYVSLAGRLGINSIKSELEDSCLQFLHPGSFRRLEEKVSMSKEKRDKYIKETTSIINDKLLEYSVKAELDGRIKSFFSLFKKMSQKGVDFDQLQSMLLFRIIVNNITECYKVLGVIHSHFTPVPGKFKDYIAIPKINGHQSLHTIIIGPKFERIEIQIRTHEMDEIVEMGVVAQQRFKDGIYSGEKTGLNWIHELLEFNKNVLNNSEFMYAVKNDLDMGEIFVLTPKGDVKELPYGGTPLDFAYAIHTDVGHRTIGIKVNGRIVNFKYILKSGDTVEILTNENQRPSKHWLNIVKTAKAKTKIKQWILKSEKETNKMLGKGTLNKFLNVLKISMEDLRRTKGFKQIITEMDFLNEDELYISIGLGKVNLKKILQKISHHHFLKPANNVSIEDIDTFYTHHNIFDAAKKNISMDHPILVYKEEDVKIHIARCCGPIPGDAIVGHMSREKGIVIHTTNCTKANLGELTRIIDVEWNPNFIFKHPVNINIVAHDKTGILSTISESINKAGVNIRSASAKSTLDLKGSFSFEIEVAHHSELLKVINSVESLKEVISVMRD